MDNAMRRITSGPIVAATMLAIATVIGCGAMERAQAQTVTLVSNLGQADRLGIGKRVRSDQFRAQRFRTGSKALGYTLESVKIKFDRVTSSAGDVTVGIYTGSASRPTTLVHALNTPSSLEGSGGFTATFTAPDNAVLSPDTRYYVWPKHAGSGNAVFVRTTNNNDEDTTSATGWTIDDALKEKLDTSAWTTEAQGQSIKMEVRGAPIPSDDAGLGAYWFSTRGEGVRTIRDDTLTQFNHIARQTTASTTINVRARHPDAETTFVVNGTAMTGEHTKFSITGLTAGAITPVVIRVTAEDGVTTRDYTVRLGRRAKEPTIKSPDAILSANITVAEWGNGMKGVFDSGPLYGWLAPKTFDVPGSERQGRLAAVVSVDMSTFRGFYANTIAACFWKSYTVPEGQMLNHMRMNLDGTDFHFKDAKRFTPRGGRCYRWPRPASGFDWSFGEVKKVELFAGVGNTPATGRHLISNPGGTGDGSLRHTNLIAVDYSNIRDADGLTRTDEWRHQWIRVDGGSEEEIPEPEGTASSYLVQADDRGKAIKVRTTFRDDAGNEESLVSETLPVLPRTLDTGLEKRPTEEGKNGKPTYVFDLKLGERLPVKVADMRSNVFEVTRGTITHTKRIDKRIRHPGGIRTAYSNHWRIRVAPDADTLALEQTVVVSLPVKACSEPGALCAGGIWVLGEAPESLVFGPAVKLSIAIGDVTASESSGRMRFPITLTRPSDWDIRLEYEITGGTATKGVDYVDPKTQGGGRDHVLVLAGRTSPKLQFDLIEDAIDDDGETITVQITSARLLQPNLVRYASDLELVLSDATATGTIENSGIMPKAWLARFGRTVASQVIDAVEGQPDGSRRPAGRGSRCSLAGRAIGSGSGAGAPEPEDEDARAKAAAEDEARSRLAAMSKWLQGAREDGLRGRQAGRLRIPVGERARPAHRARRSR